MKLAEVFSSLLSAEDQAAENVSDAKSEAERLRANARASFEDKRSGALDAAHAKARALVDGARQRGDKEVLDILNSGESERKKITELFEGNAEKLMAALANEVAEKCSARAGGSGKSVTKPKAKAKTKEKAGA